MRLSCQYCGRDHNAQGHKYQSQRSVEDHERDCPQNPSPAMRFPAWKPAKKSFGAKCPKCGMLMVLREGPYGQFWGCCGFPTCKQTMPYKPEPRMPKPTIVVESDDFEPMEMTLANGRVILI